MAIHESLTTTTDFNLEKVRSLNKLQYPRLSWNRAATSTKLRSQQTCQSKFRLPNQRCLEPELMEKNLEIDDELMRFFERDQLCKELEIYYKCKQVQTATYDAFVDDFIREHSNLSEFKYERSGADAGGGSDEFRHGFFELCKDYYEARLLVKKCTRHMNEFKWQCLNTQMRAIWNYEKYTIESNAVCGDQQHVKHELTAEKAFLNKTELHKLQTELYELRLNMIKSGLVSSQFCSKLARVKLESFLHDFLVKLRAYDWKRMQDPIPQLIAVNSEIKVLIDILFYFNRKQAKPSLKTLTSLNGGQSTRSRVKASQSERESSRADSQLGEDEKEKATNEDLDGEYKSSSKDDLDKNRAREESETDESDIEQQDETLRQDIHYWLRTLIILLLNQSDLWLQKSLATKPLSSTNQPQAQQQQQRQSPARLYQLTSIHFENLFFLVQHLLRSPDTFATNFSYLLQVPLLTLKPVPFNSDLEFILTDAAECLETGDQSNQRIHNLFINLNLNSSQSDPLINIYFDFYLKLFAGFSYEPKYRRHFLGITFDSKLSKNQQDLDSDGIAEATGAVKSPTWELIDSDGDLESLEQMLIDLSEDDLIKLYYQIPFNGLFSFLWSYLSFQSELKNANSKKTSSTESSDFRKRYVSMKIISFLDYLSRLSIRTLLIYNRSKYKSFSKLVGKTLKDSIKFASLICIQLNMDEAFMTHYDNFVKRIFTTIIYSTRCKSIRWTILSQLNIGELCLRTKWTILSIMCGVDVFHENFEHLFQQSQQQQGQSPKPQDYVMQSCANDLENLLAQNDNGSGNLSDIELLSFMRTLHFLVDVNKPQVNPLYTLESDDDNDYFEEDESDSQQESGIVPGDPYQRRMPYEANVLFPNFPSTSSDNHNKQEPNSNEQKTSDDEAFMSCVAKVLFQIAYCYQSTRDICYKEGNSLLFAICSAYPKLIGTILNEIDANLEKIGKRALYLVNELPFNKWLPYIDCKRDIDFLERCLLQTATNSILHCVATSCINNLDFRLNTKRLSRHLVKSWESKHQLKFSPSQSHKDLVDLSHFVQIKLAVVLYELHLRLTVYQYFSKNASESLIDSNAIRMEDLNKHYSGLPKDKRMSAVNWIWQTIHRLHLFTSLPPNTLADSLDRLSNIYSPSTTTSTQRVLNSHLNSLLNQLALSVPIEPKCPLEKYLNLALGCSANTIDLSVIIEKSIDIIHLILNTHKKHSKLQELSYSLIFHWFENLIFRYSTVKLKRRLPCGQSVQADAVPRIGLFRQVKQTHAQKLSTLLLIIFNPSGSSSADQVIDGYCEQIIRRLNKFNSITFKNESMANTSEQHESHLNRSFLNQQEVQRNANYTNYLYLWTELLISTIKNWHKYKCIVKLVDFLISYTFNGTSTESLVQSMDNISLNDSSASHHFINFDLLDEFMSYVRVDFGITASDSMAHSSHGNTAENHHHLRDHSPTDNGSNSDGSESLSSSQSQMLIQSVSHTSNWYNNPSINWLQSSLANVVNSTTSQLSGTVNAAIQAVNTASGNLASGDFESNQLSQFMYDKRLYKEFPYVGFYLSLCEERLENQLSLWSTFRSYLLGLNEFRHSSQHENTNTNSQSFIDACWRKSLHTINKTQSLSLSFPAQRLMLFKWCERALELPHDHPLLILYWQKFFNIYLDKDYYASLSAMSSQSSNNNHSALSYDLELTATGSPTTSTQQASAAGSKSFTQPASASFKSPTLKLFTATSQMNSLLKQMKKHLEQTSEYYAYRCHNNSGQQANNIPSAPATNYDYNEFMSKLYYALSLWTDETRLHDPNLFLPALPAHYEPNLLAKIFSKQTDLWTQFVDLTQLNEKIDSIVNANKRDLRRKHSSSNTSLQALHRQNPFNAVPSYFFKQEDRMVLLMPSLCQLGVKLKNAINEKYGSSLDTLLRVQESPKVAVPNQKEQIQLVVNISDHLIRNIFKYNKELINHTLNYMLKLDDKLTNKLLIHLWGNEVCEKYVQVPCTSLINPMHQCQRPAMIKFVYELATKRDQFRHEIKENRFNYEKLLSNFTESGYNRNSSAASRFPHDEIIKSMVAMNQLIKRLLRNHHIYQQQQMQLNDHVNCQGDTNNQTLLTKLFYLFIDLYETQMHHPNDILNSLNNSILRKSSRHRHGDSEEPQSKDWSLLLQTNSSIDPSSTLTEQHMASDSVHLYMFDLIHLIGTNFIQSTSASSSKNSSKAYHNLRKRNQQILLEKIIQKITATVQPTVRQQSPTNSEQMTEQIQKHLAGSSRNNSGSNLREEAAVPNNSSNGPTTSASSSSATSSSTSRRSCNILLNLTRNKLSLMSLCAQYVEPNDLDLFNEFYTNILCSITSIMLNLNLQPANATDNNTGSSQHQQIGGNFDSIEIINLKFSIILQLLEKFSFVNLERLIDECRSNINDSTNKSQSQETVDNIAEICCKFVDTNINFLVDLKLSPGSDQNEDNLKLIIDQCIDNFVSVLNIDYPFYFEYMLKKCLEFSSKPFALKYGCRHFSQFNLIAQQRELMFSGGGGGPQNSKKIDRQKFQNTFKFLSEFFEFERAKFLAQKQSFYSHWFAYVRNFNDIFTSLFTVYLDRFCVNDLVTINYSGVIHNELIAMLMTQFIGKYNKIWDLMLKLYTVWIEPASIKELTGHSLINVTEVYKSEITKGAYKNIAVLTKNPGAAVMTMLNSFMNLFSVLLERLKLFLNMNEGLVNEGGDICQRMYDNARNYALNKFFHFYYESIASELRSSSSINDNTLDCYHKCISEYSSLWFQDSCFEPDYRSINIMNEICWSANARQLKFLAFDIVSYLDLPRISESYFRRQEVLPQQINDFLKCWLQLLTEFCMRDSIRESKQFDTRLRPVFNQAEILQSWSMLSDTSYSDVIMNRFCPAADYHYAFASRGTDRGLLMNLLKSSAEFNSLADQNLLSCFSSAKRRCYLKAVCQILLKPSADTIDGELDAFQTCIMNLLTDIETFAISSQPDEVNNKYLKHEIQLLVDECLVLINGDQSTKSEVSCIYLKMFESWLSSSRDSPILIHFVNRLSRNLTDQSQQHCLLELCIQVFFEIEHGQDLQLNKSQQSEDRLYPDVKTLNTYSHYSIGWQEIMDNIEFKLNFSGFEYNSSTRQIANPKCNLFEYKFLENSSFLLLFAYFTQRSAMFKASYGEHSIQFADIMLNYTSQLVGMFEASYKPSVLMSAHPEPENEEKFCLLLDSALFSSYLTILEANGADQSCREKVGEQLVRISNLLVFYGEDVLSNQNPINDGQSIGSDILSSIGLNILSKKSPFSLAFRVYVRCLALCMLRRIKLVDGAYTMNEKEADSESTLSTSPSRFNPGETGQQVLFNQQFKQASYQYHLMFQTKTYSTISELRQVGSVVGAFLKEANTEHYNLTGLIKLSKSLSKCLFGHKFYLFE